MTEEIAEGAQRAEGPDVRQPARSQGVLDTPRELVRFIARMRELAGGKPAGFKLCVGLRHELLAICKAMVEEGTAPDFIIVDGSEGGTGAAPAEYEDHVGTPLTEGLMTVHNALVGCRPARPDPDRGERQGRHRLGHRQAAGAGRRLHQRRARDDEAVGCIQSQRCNTNQCPVGVATQDPKRSRALDVADKTERVYRYQHATVAEAQRLIASMGLHSPAEVGPHHLVRRVDHVSSRSYAELYEWLEPGQLLDEPPENWRARLGARRPGHVRRRRSL